MCVKKSGLEVRLAVWMSKVGPTTHGWWGGVPSEPVMKYDMMNWIDEATTYIYIYILQIGEMRRILARTGEA
jgi:hypothetical protein